MTTAGSLATPISNEVKRFGAEIRRRRQALDLSLADLAARVGLTSNFIGTIENGMRNPSISTVFSLARGLEAPAAELITEAHGLGPPGLEVARLFNEMSPVVQERFIELLRLICVRQDVVAAAAAAAAEIAAAEMAAAEMAAAEMAAAQMAEGTEAIEEGANLVEARGEGEGAEAAAKGNGVDVADAAAEGNEGEAVEMALESNGSQMRESNGGEGAEAAQVVEVAQVAEAAEEGNGAGAADAADESSASMQEVSDYQ